MKTLITIIYAVFIASCSSLKVTSSIHPNILDVSGNGFEGIILTADYDMPTPPDTIIMRFTPTKEDIIIAEKTLKNKLAEANKDRVNQGGDEPIIDKNLNKYFRQYVGFIDDRKHRILNINMLWNRLTLFERFRGWSDPREGYKDGYSFHYDGGSRYWNVRIDLNSMEIIDLWVNGVS